MFDPEKWAVWDYRATIVNDGTNTGNHDYVFVPGAGNICILIGGSVLNGDTNSRTAQVALRNADSATIRGILPGTAVAAGNTRQFPTSQGSGDGGPASVPPEVVATGTEEFLVQVQALAINENTVVALQFLVFGGPPTVTLTSPTDAVETETENRIQ